MFLGRAWEYVRRVQHELNKVETHGGVSTESLNVDIVESNILCANEEGCPAGAVQEGDTLDIDIGCIVGQKQDWTVVSVILILFACEP